MLTKAEARTQIRDWLDDPNAKRWSDARLDVITQMALDDLWTDMLDMQSWLTSQLHTGVTITSPGYIDLRLGTQGGALSQRFYRVQKVTRGGREYRPVDIREVLIEDDSAIVAPDFTYYVVGDQLWLFPLSTVADVELRYSFKPVQYTALTNGSNVLFPEGSESAYVFAAAASALAKAGAENNDQLLLLAEQARQRLFAAIRRQQVGMTVPFSPSGFGTDFGGI